MKSAIVIRAAREEEIEEIAALDVELGLGRDCPATPDTEWWGAWHGTELVGYAGGKLIETGAYYLSRAGVIVPYRGNGLQKRLIRVRVRRARQLAAPRVVTYTSPLNAASMNSLIATGFKTTKPWGADGDEVWVYWRKLLG